MSNHQLSLALIQHEVNNSIIEQRSSDGYINATALCKAAGKEWSGYYRNASTKEFMDELETDLQICRSVLVQSISGGVSQGTWVHPQVAINLAQWLSAKFAVQVSKWVHDWMSGKGSPVRQALPHHLNRYIANDGRIPTGYFSILQETGLSIFGPLHNLGFEVPKGWVPDISVGKLFCAWLRDNRGVNTDMLPTYEHDYLDGRIVDPKLYPDEYLADYRRWFREIWLPQYGVKYFRKKDPACMQYIDRLPALALSRPANQLR